MNMNVDEFVSKLIAAGIPAQPLRGRDDGVLGGATVERLPEGIALYQHAFVVDRSSSAFTVRINQSRMPDAEYHVADLEAALELLLGVYKSRENCVLQSTCVTPGAPPMQSRTLDSVAAEFRVEGHVPMQRLMDDLRTHDWEGLVWDTSMLRLWAARASAPDVELMVALADGRSGGRPLEPELHRFEVTIPGEARPRVYESVEDTVRAMREWYREKVG